jgi:hypothetical protein
MVALYAQCYPMNSRLYLRIRGSFARQQFRSSKHIFFLEGILKVQEIITFFFRSHIKSTRNY